MICGSQAKDITVQPVQSIQAAINASTPGDIKPQPMAYTESGQKLFKNLGEIQQAKKLKLFLSSIRLARWAPAHAGIPHEAIATQVVPSKHIPSPQLHILVTLLPP
jgi:hypothetical protein